MMQKPLNITFRNLPRSEAIEASVRDHAARLERFYDGIIGCSVVVEERHKHHRHGNHFQVRIDVTVPGAELVASREPDEHHAYTDAHVALRDAFDTMRRQLEDYVRHHDQRAKVHAQAPRGRVVELHPEDGFGRIETADGRQIYFHRNSVLGEEFGRLRVGTEVRFHEEAGEQGPQASTVHVLD